MRSLNSTDNILYATAVFIAIIFIDVFLVILYTITRESLPIKILLYSSEFLIISIGMYLLFKPLFTGQSTLEMPVFITIYVVYIILMCLRSLMYADTYSVLRDSRKLLAPIPPIVIGFYFAVYHKQNLPLYISWLIKFLTVVSIIGLFEWGWWCIWPESLNLFYSRFFRVGLYYNQIKYISGTTELGLLTSALRPEGFIIPTLTKRLTGLYLEPFSAGFNAALAIVLIWFTRVAGYARSRRDWIFMIINFIAVILTTSRAVYLFVCISLLVYMIVQKKYISSFIWGTVIFILCAMYYNPLVEAVNSIDWTAHRNATMSFIDYFLSFDNLVGEGIGAMEKSAIYTDCGYGAIYGQLGIAGIIAILFLYMSIGRLLLSDRENRFFAGAVLIPTLVLLSFASYPFGYKTFGLIHLCLGTLMGCHISSIRRDMVIKENIPYGNLQLRNYSQVSR
jgi:hypothetical protein